MQIGTIESIWRYPVKGMRGEEIPHVYAGVTGLMGDRVYGVIAEDGLEGFPWQTGRDQEEFVLYNASYRSSEALLEPEDLSSYEGHAPGGVAVVCEILTDNRNRTAPEIRKIFELAGGKLGATGCAAWMFERKGLLIVLKDQIDEEPLMELALEAGADDIHSESEDFEITCEVEVFNEVCNAFDQAELSTELREITRIPKDTVELDVDTGKKVLNLMERLDDHDDVQSVAANFNIPEDAMAKIEAQ